MSNLNTLLDGKANQVVNGLGYSGAMYDQAQNILQRKVSQPLHIVSSQLSKFQNFPRVTLNDLSSLIEFAGRVSNQ